MACKQDHARLEEAAIPAFDEEASKGMHEDEVRIRWPRGHWSCPDCDHHGTVYASFLHYLRGDW